MMTCFIIDIIRNDDKSRRSRFTPIKLNKKKKNRITHHNGKNEKGQSQCWQYVAQFELSCIDAWIVNLG